MKRGSRGQMINQGFYFPCFCYNCPPRLVRHLAAERPGSGRRHAQDYRISGRGDAQTRRRAPCRGNGHGAAQGHHRVSRGTNQYADRRRISIDLTFLSIICILLEHYFFITARAHNLNEPGYAGPRRPANHRRQN